MFLCTATEETGGRELKVDLPNNHCLKDKAPKESTKYLTRDSSASPTSVKKACSCQQSILCLGDTLCLQLD
ncbi:RIKEN cDNA 4933431E20, isoform CRA_a [Mus musculus]|nr:RIKEN cDNA 4933431E20, isoform CRA_a [Mus musculus]EDL01924.1 RIKEN cDNA 4933431E20, isoform CRA_a [Mus musculus]